MDRARTALCALGIDRAYLYFFTDEDTPQIHGSSGLTRNYEPKPSFHAVAWLLRSLGEYRFARVVRENAEQGYVYEFTHGSESAKRIWAVWKPAGESRQVTLDLENLALRKSERMPLSVQPAEALPLSSSAGQIEIDAAESPVFLWLETP